MYSEVFFQGFYIDTFLNTHRFTCKTAQKQQLSKDKASSRIGSFEMQ